MDRTVKITAIFLFVIGLLSICVSLLIFISENEFKKIAVPVTAVISNISTRFDSARDQVHDVCVDYVYDKVYENIEINTYNSSMFTGKEITIYVNAKYPSEIRYISYISVIFLAGMGCISFLAGWGAIRMGKK